MITYSVGLSVNVPFGQKYFPFISLILNAYMDTDTRVSFTTYTMTFVAIGLMLTNLAQLIPRVSI
jgi:hypothetical protein